MLSLQKIREDLKEIRYFYSRKEIFEAAFKEVAVNAVLEKAKKYNDAVMSAAPRLYDLYVNLYIKNFTQEGLSIELNYTPQYIQTQNKKLLLFLQSVLTE